jgi:hypothetical protein
MGGKEFDKLCTRHAVRIRGGEGRSRVSGAERWILKSESSVGNVVGGHWDALLLIVVAVLDVWMLWLGDSYWHRPAGCNARTRDRKNETPGRQDWNTKPKATCF